MPTLSAPLPAGAALPTLDLVASSGTVIDLADLAASAAPTVVYLMRTATCPVCHQHLRHLERMVAAGDLEPPVVIVPGVAADAAAVVRRHPALASRIVASPSAHAALGLFATMGLQRSGTYIVHGGRITYTRHATVPVESFDAAETLAALREAHRGTSA